MRFSVCKYLMGMWKTEPVSYPEGGQALEEVAQRTCLEMLRNPLDNVLGNLLLLTLLWAVLQQSPHIPYECNYLVVLMLFRLLCLLRGHQQCSCNNWTMSSVYVSVFFGNSVWDYYLFQLPVGIIFISFADDGIFAVQRCNMETC